jgi:hypothetical protein
MGLGLSLLLSASGVLVAAVAYHNRDKPEWQRDMRAIYILAMGQVAFGAVSAFLLSR